MIAGERLDRGDLAAQFDGKVYRYETVLEAARLCPHCCAAEPHHTVGVSAIGDARRRTIWDLHEVADTGGVGLAECLAYDAVWKGRE